MVVAVAVVVATKSQSPSCRRRAAAVVVVAVAVVVATKPQSPSNRGRSRWRGLGLVRIGISSSRIGFFPDWNSLRLSRIGKCLRIDRLAFPDWLRIGFNYPVMYVFCRVFMQVLGFSLNILLRVFSTSAPERIHSHTGFAFSRPPRATRIVIVVPRGKVRLPRR